MSAKSNIIIARWRSLTGLLVVSWLMVPAAAVAQTLEAIGFDDLPGKSAAVRLQFSDTPPPPEDFAINKPARIVLDFADTSINLEKKVKAIGAGAVDQVMAVEAGGKTRVVISLFESLPYKISSEGNVVVVDLSSSDREEEMLAVGHSTVVDEQQADADGSPGEAMDGDSADSADSGASSVDSTLSGPHIRGVDFNRSLSGNGVITIDLSSASLSADIEQTGVVVELKFPAVSLPAELDRRLDVADFATPVASIDTLRDGSDVLVKISMTSNEFDYIAYQADDRLTLEVSPLTAVELEERKKEQFAYTGERLSLNFQDIEVRAVLQLLADFTDFNLIIGDTVTGRTTLRLQDVPWDQAMAFILRHHGLGKLEEGNVLLIAPQEELAARERQQLEAERRIEEIEALTTEYIQINYAKAGDLSGLISGDQSLLSERGNVAVDPRTNTLIIQDVSSRISAVRELILQLDIPVKQVLIESRIVTTDVNFTKDLGVRFGYSRRIITDSGTLVGFGGGQAGNITYSTTDAEGNTEAVCTGFCADDSENYLVSLPTSREGAVAGIGHLAIGKLGSWLLQLELSALINEGRAQNLANPKVITVDQGQARIETGTQIPYQEASSSGATSVSFQKAVLGLTVSPQITPDDRVLLDMNVTQDSVGNISVQGTPAINTNVLQTQVLVEDGETVVLGGVFRENEDRNYERIPFFGDLPYVGFLFRRRGEQNRKQELLIFVTPKIIGERI